MLRRCPGHSFGSMIDVADDCFVVCLKFKLTRYLTGWLNVAVAKERERRQYDPVKHLKGHCQIFKAFNKKWHLPPLLSLYFFLKHEKSSKMYSFEDQNALSLFDIILVAHTEKRSAVCSFDGSPVKNQFTGSKSSGVSLIWRGFDIFCLMVRWMTYSQCVTILLPK